MMLRPLRNRWIVPLILAACFLLWRMSSFSSKPTPPPTLGDAIAELHMQAIADHQDMLDRQSKTLSAARSEYSKRYHLRPPPGYDVWYDYAVMHGSPIIDDFDTIMDDIKPFREFLKGAGWNEGRCDIFAPADDGPGTLRVCIKGHKLEVDTSISPEVKSKFVEPLEDLISDFIIHLPEVCFEMNTLDQGRLVLPYPDDTSTANDNMCRRKQAYRDLSKQNIWNEVIKSCPESSPAKSGLSKHKKQTPVGSLIRDWAEATDLCLLSEPPPTGLVQSPMNMHLGNVRKPVLSPAKLSTFGDIRYPSLLRWRDKGNITEGFQFEVKRHRLGWRGTSTGGWAHGSIWQQFQRHRMVSIAQAKALEGAAPVRKFGEQDLISTTPQLRKTLDIGFTELISCEHESCEAMKREFRIVNPLMQIQLFSNKMVLDMDADGLSGRFYQLMKSNSAILKQGMLTEWHDSRLKPWLHYIPLSMGMLEMPGMLEFLFDTDIGDNITKTIALQGRDWTNAALRPADVRVYMYRLLLEYGRRDFTPFK